MSVRWPKTLSNQEFLGPAGNSCHAGILGEDSDIRVNGVDIRFPGTAISLDLRSQATEIAPTEGILNSRCGPFGLCR